MTRFSATLALVFCAWSGAASAQPADSGVSPDFSPEFHAQRAASAPAPAQPNAPQTPAPASDTSTVSSTFSSDFISNDDDMFGTMVGADDDSALSPSPMQSSDAGVGAQQATNATSPAQGWGVLPQTAIPPLTGAGQASGR